MNSKRKMLKKIASVGATVAIVPSVWIKPTINSIILPVHAQTSVIPTIRAKFEGRFSFAILDGEVSELESIDRINRVFISKPFTRSVLARFDPVLPPDDGSAPPVQDSIVTVLVDLPLRASPSVIMTSEADLSTTVDILDAQNIIILTISVEIQFRE